MGTLGPLEIALFFIVIGILIPLAHWPWWRIFKKAGFEGWLCLGVYVPMINIALLFYMAFATWPIEIEAGSDIYT